MKLLTNHDDREEARLRLRELLASRGEWFCVEVETRGARRAGASSRATVSLRAGEWEVRSSNGALHFACWTDAGARVWRIEAWELSGAKLTLRVARRMGAERATLELVPRASVGEGALAVAAARRAACERFAGVVREHLHGAQIVSARLSAGARRSEPGRYARVLLLRRRERVAATCAVVPVKQHEIDAMLASALSWGSRLDGARTKKIKGATKLWLVVSRELSQPTAERLALLREAVRDSINLFESADATLQAVDDATQQANGDATRQADDDAASELAGEATHGLNAVEIPRLESLVARASDDETATRARL